MLLVTQLYIYYRSKNASDWSHFPVSLHNPLIVTSVLHFHTHCRNCHSQCPSLSSLSTWIRRSRPVGMISYFYVPPPSTHGLLRVNQSDPEFEHSNCNPAAAIPPAMHVMNANHRIYCEFEYAVQSSSTVKLCTRQFYSGHLSIMWQWHLHRTETKYIDLFSNFNIIKANIINIMQTTIDGQSRGKFFVTSK